VKTLKLNLTSGVARLERALVQGFQKGLLFPTQGSSAPPPHTHTAMGPRALHALHTLLLCHWIFLCPRIQTIQIDLESVVVRFPFILRFSMLLRRLPHPVAGLFQFLLRRHELWRHRLHASLVFASETPQVGFQRVGVATQLRQSLPGGLEHTHTHTHTYIQAHLWYDRPTICYYSLLYLTKFIEHFLAVKLYLYLYVRFPMEVHERGTVFRQPPAQPPNRFLPSEKTCFFSDFHFVCDNMYIDRVMRSGNSLCRIIYSSLEAADTKIKCAGMTKFFTALCAGRVLPPLSNSLRRHCDEMTLMYMSCCFFASRIAIVSYCIYNVLLPFCGE